MEILKERGILWRRVIEVKFDTTDRGRYSRGLLRPNGIGFMQGRSNFKSTLRWRVKDEEIVNF